MRRKAQDATNITSLTWGKATKSILTSFATNNPPSVPSTQGASIPLEPAASANLATHLIQARALFKKLGWYKFVEQQHQSSSNFASLNKVDHLAQRLLKFYMEQGVPVKLAT